MAHLDDAISLRELAVESFVNAYGQHNTQADMSKYLLDHFSLENVKAEITNPKMLFLLAFEHDKMLAYAKLLFQTAYQVDAKNPLEIARLYTRVELIGNGIGKKMIGEISDYANVNGFDAICLGVWQQNSDAVRFYEREGFVICGTTTFVLGTDAQDDFVMIKKGLKDAASFVF